MRNTLKEVNEVNSKDLEDYWLQQEQIQSLSWTSTFTYFRRDKVQVKKFRRSLFFSSGCQYTVTVEEDETVLVLVPVEWSHPCSCWWKRRTILMKLQWKHWRFVVLQVCMEFGPQCPSGIVEGRLFMGRWERGYKTGARTKPEVCHSQQNREEMGNTVWFSLPGEVSPDAG